MLAKRYANDGRVTLRLNNRQLILRNQVSAKVNSNVYRFESVPCCVCDSTDVIQLSEKDRYGLYLPVVICRSCGLIYTNPRMNQEAYAAFYDCEYRPLYQGKEHTILELYERNIRRGKQISKFIISSGRNVKGIRVLEVGCGAGGILAHFRDAYGCEIKGCDYGTGGIKFGVEERGLDLQKGNLQAIILKWKPDLIIYSHVFEHILDLQNECRMIRDALDDRGMVYIEVPSVKNIRTNYKWDFLLLLQNAHTYHFTLTTLSNVMTKNGFRLYRGNEFAKSLFVKENPSTSYISDFASVMDFLKRTERMHLIGKLRVSPRRIATSFLDTLGLTQTVKKMLGK